ncbi:MAG TPA: type IV toxin-antitoxin system AbiEi family antitoxin domain-containing protein [Solirubrobacterales bacterium]|nr:type IV toxin-antitoxin system AbiEi family antitoxin domain-containing protein [Solirubrobacterales bacterium]
MSCKRNRGTGDNGRTKGRDRRLGEVATGQGGVVSLDQLREIGVSPRAAAYRAEEERLHRVHRGVYAVGHLSIGRVEALRGAILACGVGAVVSHGTAAAFWGLWDNWPLLIDLTVPEQCGRKIDGIRCRRCRHPEEDEIGQREGVSCTTPARTMVDLAGMYGLDTLRRTVERAAVLKLLDLDALDRSLHFAQGRRGLRTLQMVLADWRTADGATPDVRSEFEAMVLPRLIGMGLPRPRCNETLTIGGERLMVDFLWEEQRVVVETDGAATHQTPLAFQRDRWRDQVLVAAGYRVPRVTWDQIKDEPDAVVRRIARTVAVARS